MFNRRELLRYGSAASCLCATGALAAPATDVVIDTRRLTPEMKEMLGIRMPTLDTEADEDFVVGIKKVMTDGPARPAATKNTAAFLKSHGHNILDDTNLGYEDSFDLLMQDPEYAAGTRISATIQHIMWDRAMRVFHRSADKYLTLLEKTDKTGPGTLELNPGMAIPDSCRHEIHAQPGGYVGDPLGGWVYHYAVTLGFRVGSAYHDENHLEYAQGHVKPKDGEVRRALDLGSGTGQSTTALKMRFPDTEVWGIDVGGALVRYAHHRAVAMNMDINFAQRLVEDTKFPDGHFDMVSDTILFHEVAGETMSAIVKEIYRILRPGGTFSHHDVVGIGNPKSPLPRTIMAKARAWSSHRINHERWWLEYIETDFPALLREAGFQVAFESPIRGRARVIATKPA